MITPLASLAILLAAQGAAVSADEDGLFDGVETTVALGPSVGTEYEGADEYRLLPLVVVNATLDNHMYLRTDGRGIRLNLVPSRFIQAGPTASYRLGRKDADDPVMAQLDEIDGAYEIGAFALMNLPFIFTANEKDALTIDIGALADVSGAHEGFSVRASALYRGLIAKGVVLETGPFVTYGSDSFLNAYYGVGAAEAGRSGLAAFDADGGLKDMGYTASTRFSFAGDWSVILTGRVMRALGDAEESPVVAVAGSETVAFGGAALGYSF